MRLFIAKLSVYANCVPRSQRFHCRIKTFLLFNAKSLPPWAGVYFPLWLLNTAQQFGELESAGLGRGVGGGRVREGLPPSYPAEATKPPKEASVKKFGFHRLTELCSWPCQHPASPRPQGRYGPLLPLKAVVFGRFFLSKQSFIVI